MAHNFYWYLLSVERFTFNCFKIWCQTIKLQEKWFSTITVPKSDSWEFLCRKSVVNRETGNSLWSNSLYWFFLLSYHFYLKFHSSANISWQKVQSHWEQSIVSTPYQCKFSFEISIHVVLYSWHLFLLPFNISSHKYIILVHPFGFTLRLFPMKNCQN